MTSQHQGQAGGQPGARPSRLCEPGCPDPDAPHREPEVDWIGNAPLLHGEAEDEVPGTQWTYPGARGPIPMGGDAYCFCGHPNYLTCPGAFGSESLLGLTLEPTDPDDLAGGQA